ncbi:MAG: hypothetical protein QM426_07220 [Euryarchaeota archaeon]|nr:hypothetical protein [Euryarchaeota archaeon]
MKKSITAIFLGLLLLGTFGAAVVSAVASDDARGNYGLGHMHRWAARSTGSCEGNYTSCPYYNGNETVKLEVETIDEAFEIAREKIDDGVSRDDIYQKNRWWIVNYEDEDGVYKQARIDAVTGDVFTRNSVPAGAQTGGKNGRSSGYARGQGCCMGCRN